MTLGITLFEVSKTLPDGTREVWSLPREWNEDKARQFLRAMNNEFGGYTLTAEEHNIRMIEEKADEEGT